MTKYLFFAAAALILLQSACTDPITVGSDLLAGDRAELGQTVDIPFTTRVVPDDSLLTYDASNNAAVGTFNFGHLNDPLAGEWIHSVYIIPELNRRQSTGLIDQPVFASRPEVLVDSVVLILPIDTSQALYGPGRLFPYRLNQLAGAVDQSRDYDSNVSFPRGFNELNRENVFLATRAPRLLYDTIVARGADSSRYNFPHVRIPFDQQFVDQLNLRDASTFESDTTFWEFLAGFQLEPTEVTNALLKLQPLPARAGEVPFAGLYFFYPDTLDQRPTFYRAPLSLSLPRYERNYAGSLAGDLLLQGTNNERTFLGGQASLMTEINFPDLSSLEDVVVNQAEIKLYLEDVAGYDYADYPHPTFIALYYRDGSGNLTPILDRQLLGNPNSSLAIRQFLGGNPQEDEDGNIFYLPRFSVHLQRMIDGTVPSTIYARVVPLDRDPSRALLAGPEASVRPATVKVTFTKLD